MTRASGAKQELCSPSPVKPATNGQRLSAGLSNRARPPDPGKRKPSAVPASTTEGGIVETATKQPHVGHYVPTSPGSRPFVVVEPNGFVVAIAASRAEARALLHEGGARG